MIYTQPHHFKKRIAELRANSNYFPEITFEQGISNGLDGYPPNKARQLFASTLVRIERDGVWYVVHCVESCIDDCSLLKNPLPQMLNRFTHSISMIQLFYKPVDKEKDVLQISEHKRLNPNEPNLNP